MKKKKEEKHISLRKHAKKRALERYDVNLTTENLKYIVQRIQNNIGSIFIYKKSNSRKMFLVKYINMECLVLYDCNREEIITFLPIDSLEKYKVKEKERLLPC